MVHIRTLVLGTVILSCAVVLPNTTRAQGLDLKAQEEDIKIGGREYSPYLNRGYSQRVFWGDTHLHTSYSTDAGMIGNRLGPEEAYRFARGEIVVSSTGVRARLQRPLDFLVVAIRFQATRECRQDSATVA